MILSIKFPDTKERFTILIPGIILRTISPKTVFYEAGYLQYASIVSHFAD